MEESSAIFADGVKQLNQLLLSNAIVHFWHEFMKLFRQLLALLNILFYSIN